MKLVEDSPSFQTLLSNWFILIFNQLTPKNRRSRTKLEHFEHYGKGKSRVWPHEADPVLGPDPGQGPGATTRGHELIQDLLCQTGGAMRGTERTLHPVSVSGCLVLVSTPVRESWSRNSRSLVLWRRFRWCWTDTLGAVEDSLSFITRMWKMPLRLGMP